MPCAISTFSESSERNSSVVNDSEIAVSIARIVACIGLPSSTASKPSTLGAFDFAAARPPSVSTATRPSSRNCRESAARPGFVEHAARLVPHLTTQAGNAEQFVHRREVEQLDVPQAIGELHGRQRLEPQRAATLRRNAPSRQGP